MSASFKTLWPSIRTSILLLVLLGALYSSYRIGQAFAEWREPRVVAPAYSSAAIALNPLAAALTDGGQWSFANLAWDIRSRVLPAADAESRLESIVAAPPAIDPTQLPDASPELMRFIASARLIPTEQAGVQIYRLDRPTLKAVLLLRKIEDRTKAVFGAVAFPHNDREWQEFEFVPSSTSAAHGPRTTHLLPLPTGAIQSGARFAGDGRPLLEMITTQTTADALLTNWKEAGWEIRPSRFGAVTGFSYLCARGNEVVYAWSADANDSLQHLMLVRSPSDAEMQPKPISPMN